MSKFTIYIYMLMAVVTFASCEYQPILEREVEYKTAYLPVKIDWSKSGFEIDQEGNPTKQGGASVHRATVRFFPKDGVTEPFERYLESNVFEDEIEVPAGVYDVIVMNESCADKYWHNTENAGLCAISFENNHSFEDFAASVYVKQNNPTGYFFKSYEESGCGFIDEPLRLSTWSVKDLVVNNAMVEYSQKSKYSDGTKTESLKGSDEDMFYALTRAADGSRTGIEMRPLTRDVNVTLRVKNLSSTKTVTGAIVGFVNKVNMATGIGYRVPSEMNMLHYFTFSGRTNWVDADGNPAEGPIQGEDNSKYKNYTGETSASFLSFGREFDLDQAESYLLDLDFLYINGSLLDKQQTQFNVDMDRDGVAEVTSKLPFDVTSQMKESSLTQEEQHYLNVDLYVSTLEVEYTGGTIDAKDWEDDVVIPL